jgi:flagellar biosynthesis/type III secretory pathway chaperone
MTPVAPLPSLAAGETALLDLDAAQARVQALDALLQEEFEVLRSQAFDRLETLQNEKIALLEALQTTALQVAALPEPPQAWTEVIEALEGCRSAYRRNEMLVTRQIEVVGATLRSLQSADTTASVDLYDRLGQLSRRGGRRLYSEA